jgi:uncharacterized protein (DUF1330 family)
MGPKLTGAIDFDGFKDEHDTPRHCLEDTMAKGYWIARVDVHDPETYKDYITCNQVAFSRFGGRYLIRGTPFDDIEGTSRSRNVVVEFPSLEMARACYHSPEYQKGVSFRKASAVADLIIIEGYDGPQPGEPAKS